MGALSGTRKNIIEWSQHFHRGKVLPQVRMLAQENHSLMDWLFTECNDGTGELYNVETAEPTVYKTAWGEGTPESKSQKAQLREVCTMLTGFSSVETEMAKVGGQKAVVRAEEDESFASAMRKTAAQMQFYANRNTNLKDFYGFATLYNSINASAAKLKNTISAGGTTNGTLTSAFLVNWGKGVYGIFPEGTQAGLQKLDLGTRVKTLANGNELVVDSTKHTWHLGLVVKDWRDVVRICNIKASDCLALTNNMAPTSLVNLLHLMIRARLRIRNPGKKVWYVNDTVYGCLMRVALEKSNAALKVEQAITQFGNFDELTILGIPVRRCDQILDTEDQVS